MIGLFTNKTYLRVLKIVEGTIVDGPGLRTSIYFAGCPHHCPGCHNPESWDSSGGEMMSLEDIVEIVKANNFDVTFSGGEPLMQIDSLLSLAKHIKGLGLGIWLYTGYTYQDIVKSDGLRRILDYVDAIVDGRFELPLRDTSLRFRGSSNQRIIKAPFELSLNHME